MELAVKLRIKCRVFVGYNYLTMERYKDAVELADFMDESLPSNEFGGIMWMLDGSGFEMLR